MPISLADKDYFVYWKYIQNGGDPKDLKNVVYSGFVDAQDIQNSKNIGEYHIQENNYSELLHGKSVKRELHIKYEKSFIY